jgi:hypothetical protein
MSKLQDAKRNADSVHPIVGAAAVTKSDTTVIPNTRGLWVGVGGAVTVRLLDGSTVAFAGVQNGTLLPVQVDQVRDATTASSIVALY